MDIQRGFRDKLEKYVNVNADISVELSIRGGAVYDFCCFGVDEAGRLSDDRYMVFYNQTRSPLGEIRYTAGGGKALFTVGLSRLPASINKLVFTASIDGGGTMGEIAVHTLTIGQNGRDAVWMALAGEDFHAEKAIISIEIYKKDVWRFAAVASGFNGGLGDLLRSYGGTEAAPAIPAPRPQPVRITPPPPSPQPSRVELKKGRKLSLSPKGMGDILINLNWYRPPAQYSGFGAGPEGINLELGCLYELRNGRKGCIQALGRRFGSLAEPPYVSLDGETLRVNGAMVHELKRLLIYTYIYEGAADWREADAAVTVKRPGNPDVTVRLDEYDSDLLLCAIALMENCGQDSLSVEKIVQFYRRQEAMDRAFGWGLRWSPGRK